MLSFFTLKRHAPMLLFVLGVMLLGLLPEALLSHLEFYYAEGLSWRWFTAHFIHLGYHHLLLNMAGVVVMWFLAVMYVPRGLLLLLVVSLPLLISAGLYLLGSPDNISGYRGFSGAIYGFMVAGSAYLYRRDAWVAIGLLGFVIVKIIFEQLPSFDANYMQQTIGGAVEENSHLFGAVFGFFITMLYVALAVRKVPGFVKP